MFVHSWQTRIQALSFANAQGSWKIIQTFGPPVSETSSISDTLMENHTRPGAFAFFFWWAKSGEKIVRVSSSQAYYDWVHLFHTLQAGCHWTPAAHHHWVGAAASLDPSALGSRRWCLMIHLSSCMGWTNECVASCQALTLPAMFCVRLPGSMGNALLHVWDWWYLTWVFPKILVPQNGWFIMENPIKMDDLEVPQFLETSTWTWWDDCHASDLAGRTGDFPLGGSALLVCLFHRCPDGGAKLFCANVVEVSDSLRTWAVHNDIDIHAWYLSHTSIERASFLQSWRVFKELDKYTTTPCNMDRRFHTWTWTCILWLSYGLVPLIVKSALSLLTYCEWWMSLWALWKLMFPYWVIKVYLACEMRSCVQNGQILWAWKARSILLPSIYIYIIIFIYIGFDY